ncbi:MAG: hypothetical protein A2Y14_03580 [Verrucomicrobia bacterium GWF2_51_19]|nr:MAG: hypothetical protein A2Y14_03580 [Verrucomicrobia bacterium GWF2_51_19]HCJ12406.1 hypothetical protein [Opitutae bacterium]
MVCERNKVSPYTLTFFCFLAMGIVVHKHFFQKLTVESPLPKRRLVLSLDVSQVFKQTDARVSGLATITAGPKPFVGKPVFFRLSKNTFGKYSESSFRAPPTGSRTSMYATPARARAKPSFDSIFQRYLFIDYLQRVRPVKNGSIARLEERGPQRTYVRDLARMTKTQLDISQWSYKKVTIVRGDRIKAKATLAAIETLEASSFRDHLRSRVSAVFSRGSVTSIDQKSSFWHCVNETKALFIQKLRQCSAEEGYTNVLLGMLFGEKGLLELEQRQRFIRTGTFHLFAVSGLHIGVLFAAFFGFFRLLRLPLFWTRVASLSLLAGFVLLIGLPASALRAFLMISFYEFACFFQRKPIPLSSLIVSAIAILLFVPDQLFAPGFQMSYAIVAALILYGVPLSQWISENVSLFRYLPPKSWKWYHVALAKSASFFQQGLCFSIAATLISLPLTIIYFNLASPFSFLVNCVLIPLASITLPIGIATLALAFLSETMASWLHAANIWTLRLMDALLALGDRLPAYKLSENTFTPILTIAWLILIFILPFSKSPKWLWAPIPVALLALL